MTGLHGNFSKSIIVTCVTRVTVERRFRPSIGRLWASPPGLPSRNEESSASPWTTAILEIEAVRWIAILITGIASAGLIVVSVVMNWAFGSSFGRTALESHAYGA